jgi:hypothetical protein
MRLGGQLGLQGGGVYVDTSFVVKACIWVGGCMERGMEDQDRVLAQRHLHACSSTSTIVTHV